jgi:hypothetical protein
MADLSNREKALQVLEKQFQKSMKRKDFKAFVRDYPTLVKVILDTVEEVTTGSQDLTKR